MLKKTTMAAIAALFAAIALSAQPNKNSGNKEAPAPDKNAPVILAAPEHQNDRKTDAAKAKTDPPPSNTPLKDPNWVLVIVGSVTCLVIGWQAIETRKAAEVSRQALIAQFRPKVIVRRIVIDPCSVTYFDRRGDEAEWKISLHLHNAGGTVAHVHKYSTWLHLFHAVRGGTKALVGVSEGDAPFDIPAGGNKVIDLTLDRLKFREMLIAIRAERDRGKESDYLVYLGTISYADDNGTTRDTGFYRLWQGNENQFFIAAKDPDLEYQD